MKKIKVGIVGCGAIGSSLSRAIIKNFPGKAQLAALYDLDSLKSKALAGQLKRRHLAVRSLGSLIRRSGFVIEAASADASFKVAKMALSNGKSVMIMSVGGIVKGFKALSGLAARNNCRVYIPSGAISGIDALKAANMGKISQVTLTTTKNPLGFKGVKYVLNKGIDLNRIKGEKVLFSGKAADAIKYFPQNINVAAVLSLSGIGIANTKVRIIASPKALRNIHEIKIESAAGDISTRTENILHPDNPKTSYLAVLSAVAALKRILEPVVIGT
jgi:aspartate dehydrogenase